jgi:serine protease Do
LKKFFLITIITLNSIFALNIADELNKLFVDVAEKGKPAVVSIISEKSITQEAHPFFFSPFGQNHPGFEKKGQSLGSGVIINAKEGYILTNNHVIEDSDNIKVMLLDKRELEATIVGVDPLSDVAIIKIEADDLIQAEIGNSDELNVGEWVMAIGSPFGLHLNHSVTKGIVGAIGRNDVISRLNYEDFIQHDAAINPGNSGGALYNLYGKLIGINTAIATGGMSNSNAGIGFAIPVNQAMRIVEDLISTGTVTRGWLGVSIQDIDKNMAKALNIGILDGAIISQVLENSPAEEYGILEQDIVISINGSDISNSSQLKNVVSSFRPGEVADFLVLRDNNDINISVILGERPNEKDLASVYKYGNPYYDILGLMVEDVSSSFAKDHDINEPMGVIVKNIKKNSPATRDMQKGDVITKIGRNKITSINDYRSLLKQYKNGDSVLLLVKRNGSSRFVALEV